MKNLILVVLFFILLPLYSYDYLDSSSATATTVTPINNGYGNVCSTSLDVTNVDKVLVLAAMEMRKYGSSGGGREAWFKITDGNEATSGEIIRQVQAIDNNDYGIGTLVHIFDTSSISGSITYTLEHKNTKLNADSTRRVETKGILTAISLETEVNGYLLSNSSKRLGDSGTITTSSTYASITGLETGAVNLPVAGAIYVAASIDCYERDVSSAVGTWKIQYKKDGDPGWTDLGIPVSRTMARKADDGIVSLVAIAENLTAGNYYFTVSHKRSSGAGTVTTHNSNIVAVALTHSNNFYFPHFYNKIDSAPGTTGQTGVTDFPTDYANINTESIYTADDVSSQDVDILVHAQFNAQASGLSGTSSVDRMISEYRVNLNGTPSFSGIPFKRVLSKDSDIGSGGIIDLIEDINGLSSYTAALQHRIYSIPGTNPTGIDTLTSSNLVLAGFQLFDDDPDNPLPIVLSTFTATFMDGNANLNWSTVSETNNQGWNIYRGISNSASEAIQLNFNLIEGAGTTTQITEYTYYDESLAELVELQNLENGDQVWFWLESVSSAGETNLYDPVSLTILEENENPPPEFPDNFGLFPNYPNPFNPQTKICFNLNSDELVRLSIYNLKGQKIRTLFDGLASGQTDHPHEYTWDGLDSEGRKVNSGIYLYKLESGEFSYTRKMILLK